MVADESTFFERVPGLLTVEARGKGSGETTLLQFDLRSGEVSEVWRARGSINSLQPAGGQLVARYEDFSTPPDIYLFSRNMRTRSRLSNISPEFAGLDAGSAHIVEAMVPQRDAAAAT